MLESLLFMILRGMLIGVVVSAPMGPVGIFCIQRTLDKGRLSGFYTGVGAAISDLIYCFLTGFGLSFIEDFINNHRSPIQLLGSAVLIVFGIWLIRKKPDGSLPADPDHDAPSREGDILKGFALTFSNPLILFLIIGLFAQFNFVIEGMKFYHYVLGFLGIISGALGWWWIVTYFVDKIRGHFTQRTMKRINTIVGIIILIFAAFGIFSSASTLWASPAPSPSVNPMASASVSFRVADEGMKGWTATFPDDGDSGIRLEVSHETKEDPFGFSIMESLYVAIVELPSGKIIASKSVDSGIDAFKGSNSWRLMKTGHTWSLFAGNREYRHVFSFESGCRMSDPDIRAVNPGKISVSAYLSSLPNERQDEYSLSEEEIFSSLNKISSETSGLVGLYSMLDYEHDDTYARLGGNYRMAILAAPDERSFNLYYLGGAKVNPMAWKAGMTKGRLLPSPFANLYDVEWCDAAGDWMLRDIQAQFDPLLGTLTVKFPYQASSIRFKKEEFNP